MTNTITKATGLNQQVLDKLKVERERGITGMQPTVQGNHE
jgi:translation elongation factor EF-4